jgi:hypothetical protein
MAYLPYPAFSISDIAKPLDLKKYHTKESNAAEKEEEDPKIIRLKEENSRLRKSLICQRCTKEKVQILFLPCRHLVSCEKCGDRINYCIKCGEKVLGTVRTYFA